MKKSTNRKGKPYPTQEDEKLPILEEPTLRMRTINKLPAAVADFPYKKFKKIADMVPFSLAEWATILHLSERTLQRYAKENKNFEGIYVDRILQLESLIEMGLETFDTPEAFYGWLKKPKIINGYEIDFSSLSQSQGIQELHDQLGRIQHGVF
ncbi:type II RES/Xre toxin-antitoxin system antitoxin [Aridibaculum aurantiacum]|uniref:type II RES/Xre toxin-antitoxin system antitoxin n=1 Tax=Aridibaculum aurantiacum TaxID=2810307 RepID=UPI001A957707|nr:antitoxin Xre-like helix-turn-helix domain-containing protein [Aridibaculum aurantiacum]